MNGQRPAPVADNRGPRPVGRYAGVSWQDRRYHRDDTAHAAGLTRSWAIAQRSHGPVGTLFLGGSIASGYDKNDTYDSRLLYISPPLFINPARSSFGVASWAEILAPDGLSALD